MTKHHEAQTAVTQLLHLLQRTDARITGIDLSLVNGRWQVSTRGNAHQGEGKTLQDAINLLVDGILGVA